MVGEFAPEPQSRPLLCVSTSSWDKLILVNLPGSLESKVNQLVEAGWGVQSAKLLEKVQWQYFDYLIVPKLTVFGAA